MEAIQKDYRQAKLSKEDRAMLDFAVKLTLTPSKMAREDVALLREHEFEDSSIHDIVQVTALFNYFDRLADGMGVDPES